jgi:hypothetical protein
MDTLKIRLDAEMDHALLADAARHLRPVDWHAKALLRQALGLAFPYHREIDVPKPQAPAEPER